MQVRIRISLLFLAAVLGIAAIPSQVAADPVADLVRQSGFIFRGTVLRQGEATMPGVPVDAATTVVKVQEVLYTPPGLDDFTGRTITVQLAAPGLVRVGEPAAFFTRTTLASWRTRSRRRCKKFRTRRCSAASTRRAGWSWARW
jgi:hypothetical protein